MTIQDLGALGELLGSVAVLATLIYLALQTRQNTAAIGAQLDAAQINAVYVMTLTPATSTELLDALAEERVESRSTSDVRRDFYWSAYFAYVQWAFTQARRGLLPTYYEGGWAMHVLSNLAQYPSAGRWWEECKLRYLPEFVEWVEEQRSKAA